MQKDIVFLYFSAEVLDENNNIYTHEDDVFEGLKLKACVASMHQNTVSNLTNYSFIFFFYCKNTLLWGVAFLALACLNPFDLYLCK